MDVWETVGKNLSKSEVKRLNKLSYERYFCINGNFTTFRVFIRKFCDIARRLRIIVRYF